jgi:hypothetical protein
VSARRATNLCRPCPFRPAAKKSQCPGRRAAEEASQRDAGKAEIRHEIIWPASAIIKWAKNLKHQISRAASCDEISIIFSIGIKTGFNPRK